MTTGRINQVITYQRIQIPNWNSNSMKNKVVRFIKPIGIKNSFGFIRLQVSDSNSSVHLNTQTKNTTVVCWTKQSFNLKPRKARSKMMPDNILDALNSNSTKLMFELPSWTVRVIPHTNLQNPKFEFWKIASYLPDGRCCGSNHRSTEDSLVSVSLFSLT